MLEGLKGRESQGGGPSSEKMKEGGSIKAGGGWSGW